MIFSPLRALRPAFSAVILGYLQGKLLPWTSQASYSYRVFPLLLPFISVSVNQDIRELDGLYMHVSFVVRLQSSLVPASGIQLSWGQENFRSRLQARESQEHTVSTYS